MKKLLAGVIALAVLMVGPVAYAQIATGYTDQLNNHPVTIGVTPLNPLPVTAAFARTSTNASSTVTAGGTYQTLFAASTTRKGCLIQNPTTATEVLNVRLAGAAVFTLPAGATFNCAAPSGVVASDLVEVTAATTAHAFTAVSQ